MEFELSNVTASGINDTIYFENQGKRYTFYIDKYGNLQIEKT